MRAIGSLALIVLGLESSCDETAAAVVARDGAGPGRILSNVVYGQADLHMDFGGVVPEIAARAHAERADLVIEQAMAEAGMAFADLDAIAVTAGPGLIGGVMAGVMTARGLAAGAGLPLYGVNHLEGHTLTPRLTDGLDWPYLMLLVSGGHCQFLTVTGPGSYSLMGGTVDDAVGEAFDKCARFLDRADMCLERPVTQLPVAAPVADAGGKLRVVVEPPFPDFFAHGLIVFDRTCKNRRKGQSCCDQADQEFGGHYLNLFFSTVIIALSESLTLHSHHDTGR